MRKTKEQRERVRDWQGWYVLYESWCVLYVYVGVFLGLDLAEEQVELLARAVVSSLGQEELDLLLNLLLIQVPAVLIIHTSSRCGVRGPYTHTHTLQILNVHKAITFFPLIISYPN